MEEEEAVDMVEEVLVVADEVLAADVVLVEEVDWSILMVFTEQFLPGGGGCSVFFIQ